MRNEPASPPAGESSTEKKKDGSAPSASPRVVLNPDADTVARIREGLKSKGGYCPCRIPKIPENKCMCKEFRDQIADPDFEGFCHCGLYYKSKG